MTLTPSVAHVSLAVAVAAALSGLSAPVAAQDLGLPMAELRAGNVLAPTWAPTGEGTQPQQSLGDAILHLSDSVIVSGPPLTSSSRAAVAVWVPPAPGDAIATFGWRNTQNLVPIDAPSNVGPAGAFGISLAGDEHWLFVGAPNTSVDGISKAGVVHVFHRNDAGPWSPMTILTNPMPESNARFGTAVDFDGSTLVVGVPGRISTTTMGVVGGADRFVVGESIGPGVSYIADLGQGFLTELGKHVAIHGTTFVLSDPLAQLPPTFKMGAVLVLTVAEPDSPDVTVDALINSPASDLISGFGDEIDFDGMHLGVSAPSEDPNGVVDAGIVRLYERTRMGWVVTHSFVGEHASDRLSQVALDGDLVSIGSRWVDNGELAAGSAWLYSIAKGGTSLLARINSTEAPTAYLDPSHTAVGRNVALGVGRWSIAQRSHSVGVDNPTVRSFLVSSVLGDCDADGESDLDAILAGAPDCDGNGIPDDCASEPDCDGNSIPDACETAWQPSVEMPPGTPVWWGVPTFGGDDVIGAMWIVPLEVPVGTDGFVRGVEADWVSPNPWPQPTFVAIYDDPNQDGDPTDATFRSVWGVAPSLEAGPDRVIIDPVEIGPAGTRYFVGLGIVRYPAATSTMYVRAVPLAAGQSPKSWFAYSGNYDFAKLNIEHPSQNEDFEVFPSALTFACSGLFYGLGDLNGDGVPDVCACDADLNGSGAVAADDLAVLLSAWGGSGAADLDHDGVVGAADLAVLLASWGPC